MTVPQEYASNVVDMLNRRKGDMLLMAPCEGSEGMTLLTFLVPTRGECVVLCCFVVKVIMFYFLEGSLCGKLRCTCLRIHILTQCAYKLPHPVLKLSDSMLTYLLFLCTNNNRNDWHPLCAADRHERHRGLGYTVRFLQTLRRGDRPAR